MALHTAMLQDPRFSLFLIGYHDHSEGRAAISNGYS